LGACLQAEGVQSFWQQGAGKARAHVAPMRPGARARRLGEVPPEDLLRSPCGDTFVRARRAKGILPEVLEELLAARKRAKADLKAATDPFRKAVLDGRQLALKARRARPRRACPAPQGDARRRSVTRRALRARAAWHHSCPRGLHNADLDRTLGAGQHVKSPAYKLAGAQTVMTAMRSELSEAEMFVYF